MHGWGNQLGSPAHLIPVAGDLPARATTRPKRRPEIVARFRAPRLSTTWCDDPPIPVSSFIAAGSGGGSQPAVCSAGPAPFVRAGPDQAKPPAPSQFSTHSFSPSLSAIQCPATLSRAVGDSGGLGVRRWNGRYRAPRRPPRRGGLRGAAAGAPAGALRQGGCVFATA